MLQPEVVWPVARCLVPAFHGANFSREWKEALCQILHRGATTTEAVRRAIQHSQESLRTPARRHGINHKTVQKWRKRCSVTDLRTGPKHPRSTVLTVEQEVVIVAFRRHTLLLLDDCLYALQATIPHLARSSLHRCLERHGISRLPEVEGSSKPGRKKLECYPIGYFHIDLAEVRTAGASFISSWPSTAPRSSLSWRWLNVPTCKPLWLFWKR
jgi:transposase-like protein